MTGSTRHLLVAATIAVLITGCAKGAPEPTPATLETSTATQDATDREAPSSETEAGQPDHDEPSLPPLATWDAAAEQHALGQAEGFVRSYARPDLPTEEWFTGVAGYLSPSAIESYSYTDPAFIAATSVTGDPYLVSEPTGTSVTVAVPTDAGELHVLLVRGLDSEPWLVSTLESPSAQ